MIRRFDVRNMYDKHKKMGELYYNTETKQFRFKLLKSYKGLKPDFFMQRCEELGYSEMPDWMLQDWLRSRLCPPNRHGIGDILKMAGLMEYDQMGLFDFTHGACVMDGFYFDEVGGLAEYRKTHDKYWKDFENYLVEKGDKR